MRFLHPQYLWLLLFIPIMPAIYIAGIKKTPSIKVGAFRALKKIFRKSYRARFRHLLFALRLTAIALTIIILAQPQTGHEKTNVNKVGIDIIITFDVSESMLAEDLLPNRITAAKETVREFVKGIENDRVGLVVFAGRAFTQAPLTFDYEILVQYLEEVSTDSINQNVRGLNGTAIGNAISSAMFKLEKSEGRSKVIILLTDGESNTGINPVMAAKLAGEEGIKIYTIGIGKEGGAQMPYFDSFGNKHYARNRDGTFQLTTLDEGALKEIASATKGRYFRATDNQKLKEIFKEIGALEKKDIEIERFTQYQEDYEKYAWALLWVFLAEFILARSLFKVYS